MRATAGSSQSTSAIILMLLGVATAVVGQATRTSEAQEAAISNPSTECQDYTYEPVTKAQSSFPEYWTYAANILPGDTAGHAKYASFNTSIPNIKPKGTLTGNTAGLDYPDSDPDCWWTFSNCVTPKLSGLQPDVADVPEPKTVGYGFDDGPYCGHNVFYDYLAEQNQKATFYYIGSNVMTYPLEAQRAVADGHQICVHTWSHNYMTATSNEGAFAELWYAMQAIKLVTGVTPTCWRPPYGDVDNRIRYIAAQLGLETVIWKYDSSDWSEGSDGVTAEDIQKNYDDFIAKANQGAFDTVGAIILTHELNNFTMQIAIDNHPKLLTAFEHLVPISVAQNKTTPYVESNYTMPTFAEYIAGTTATNGSALTASLSASVSASASKTLSTSSNPATTSQSSKQQQNTHSGAYSTFGRVSLSIPVASVAIVLALLRCLLL